MIFIFIILINMIITQIINIVKLVSMKAIVATTFRIIKKVNVSKDSKHRFVGKKLRIQFSPYLYRDYFSLRKIK